MPNPPRVSSRFRPSSSEFAVKEGQTDLLFKYCPNALQVPTHSRWQKEEMWWELCNISGLSGLTDRSVQIMTTTLRRTTFVLASIFDRTVALTRQRQRECTPRTACLTPDMDGLFQMHADGKQYFSLKTMWRATGKYHWQSIWDMANEGIRDWKQVNLYRQRLQRHKSRWMIIWKGQSR